MLRWASYVIKVVIFLLYTTRVLTLCQWLCKLYISWGLLCQLSCFCGWLLYHPSQVILHLGVEVYGIKVDHLSHNMDLLHAKRHWSGWLPQETGFSLVLCQCWEFEVWEEKDVGKGVQLAVNGGRLEGQDKQFSVCLKHISRDLLGSFTLTNQPLHTIPLQLAFLKHLTNTAYG